MAFKRNRPAFTSEGGLPVLQVLKTGELIGTLTEQGAGRLSCLSAMGKWRNDSGSLTAKGNAGQKPKEICKSSEATVKMERNPPQVSTPQNQDHSEGMEIGLEAKDRQGKI